MEKFQIVLHIDEAALTRQALDRPTVFGIHVAMAGISFPDESWDDFGIVMLAAWLERIFALTTTKSGRATLRFMDGPYLLQIKPTFEAGWLVSGVERGREIRTLMQAECDGHQIARELLRASRQALEAHRNAGRWSVDCESLSKLCVASLSQ